MYKYMTVDFSKKFGEYSRSLPIHIHVYIHTHTYMTVDFSKKFGEYSRSLPDTYSFDYVRPDMSSG